MSFKRGFLFLFVLFFPGVVFSLEKATVALVYDGKSWEENDFVSKIKGEVVELLEHDFLVEFVTFVDDWSREESETILLEALGDAGVDVVIPVGILASAAAVKQESLAKPVVLAYDIRLFLESPYAPTGHLPKNLIYFKGKRDFLTDFKLFDEVTHARKIAVIGDKSLIGLKEFPQIQNLIRATAESFGNRVELIPVEDVAQGALDALSEVEVEGVFFLPTWRLSPAEFETLVSGVNALDLPSFSFLGEEEVTRGVLMTTASAAEQKRTARRIALNTLEALHGADASTIVVEFARTDQLIINEQTAKAIGLNLTWKVLSEAKLVEKVSLSNSEFLNLRDAATLAIQGNLDLSAERFAVLSGKELVLKKLAPLLPQLGSTMVGRVLDTNQAKWGRGATPQRLVGGGLHLDQSIFDDRRLANYSIERNLQKAREWQERELELDVTLNATVTYLVVLRINAEKKIGIENLNLTKANLRRAQELVDSGQARLSEVYRWESELSSNRESLVSIEARLDNAKAEFNRILNRPLKSAVYLQDVYPEHPSFLTDLGSVAQHINTPKRFGYFKEFLMCIAREKSPEILAIDEEICAQRRELTHTKRAFYLPVVSGFADVEKSFWQGGAGDRSLPGLSNTKAQKTVGISLSYPLFTGGERKADMNKAFFDLMKLKRERGALVERVEERVIQEADLLKANYENIFFSKHAKEAAEKNLVIVSNSYARGVVSIVDLIDAQNTAIVARNNYSNTIYDYLINFMRLQRSIGEFIYFYSPADKECFVQKLKNYVQAGDVIHAL